MHRFHPNVICFNHWIAKFFWRWWRGSFRKKLIFKKKSKLCTAFCVMFLFPRVKNGKRTCFFIQQWKKADYITAGYKMRTLTRRRTKAFHGNLGAQGKFGEKNGETTCKERLTLIKSPMTTYTAPEHGEKPECFMPKTVIKPRRPTDWLGKWRC